ncbi:MAG TPA: hypothetical protein ENL41_00905 [candidate division WOR-3 bacterium]|uniref:DUF948 domain-containing protein n=1 Tax=candidate division WOR-3 bacterium TaxID=2052148 RepID=A0A7C5I4B0_UNCW3|nr:MAG: hypothetical protein DRQ03_01680 [Candidatus Hydrothermae bacterium]HHF57966.1 hypothetical protein [candidate division WOR-3 bacterium]
MDIAIKILLIALISTGVILGVFLLMLILKLHRILDEFSITLQDLEGSLPEILENIKLITERTKNMSIKAEQTANTISRNLVYLSTLAQAVKIMKNIFSKKKEEAHE